MAESPMMSIMVG